MPRYTLTRFAGSDDAELGLHMQPSRSLEHLSREDIEFLRRFRRTFECILARESSQCEGERELSFLSGCKATEICPSDIIPELNTRNNSGKETPSRIRKEDDTEYSKGPISEKPQRNATWVSALDAYKL